METTMDITMVIIMDIVTDIIERQNSCILNAVVYVIGYL